ncbi:MAG: phosphoenolpyruvate carboxykinase (ATP) [Deltaproteobacteria bacterium]|nr:phosphoenolpyruvate carboxykinase (ATP) [Deltaproteobacteria bacterium]
MSTQRPDKLASWLAKNGIHNLAGIHANLTIPALIEAAVKRHEGMLARGGAFITRTGRFTGRAAQDKYVVRDGTTEALVDWTTNQPFDPANWSKLYTEVTAFLQGRELFLQDVYAGADPENRLPVRVITLQAWHSHFARNMFIMPPDDRLPDFEPAFTVIHVPIFQATPETDGTRSPTFVIMNFTERKVLIGGTSYAGEIKKSIFTVMNWLMPQRNVLSMHCSANIGRDGDTAIFFGLSGTGKTTLSADPHRALIGDDEHIWTDRGVANIEGGCYAKVIHLSKEAEPEIHATTRMFATILENVVMDPATRMIDLDDASLTENTRASYRLDRIPNYVPSGSGGHPRNIIFLTCDAFGVLPPISRLTADQAMYHFLSGYTAKVAGTELGVKEPSATFSACFGAPFMPLRPYDYAKLLGEKMARTGANAWLVNTGWTGGPYGEGKRMSIKHTRALLNAALSGQLRDAHFVRHPIFNVEMPTAVDGVPPEVLDPKQTWRDPSWYDEKARQVAQLFTKNFQKFGGQVPEKVQAAGPVAT